MYLTQRVSTQTSDSEAINKIINDILTQTEKKNFEKKNSDPLDYLWNAEEQVSAKNYNIRSSMKPRIVHNSFLMIDPQRENLNPTLRLHDILPGLRPADTPSVRTTKDAEKTSKQTTTTSQSIVITYSYIRTALLTQLVGNLPLVLGGVGSIHT